jgi:TRAP-type C4-dicarboxylate transport system permease small subunit
MVYMALLATEAGLRDGSQIAITMLVDRFGGTPRALLDIVAKLIVAAFAAVVFVSSFTMLGRQLATGQISPGLRIPMFYPYLAVTLAFGIITAVQTATLVLMVVDMFRGNGVREGGAA